MINISLLPELEKSLPLLLERLQTKFDKEKDRVLSILNRFTWHLVDSYTDCSCAAVDSSFVVIESRIGYVYVVQGVAVLYTVDNGVLRKSDALFFSDTGLISVEPLNKSYITKKSLYKKALTEYAYMLELEKLTEIMRKHSCDLALVDGSFISFMLDKRSKDFDVYIEGRHGTFSLDNVEKKKMEYLNILSRSKKAVFLAKSSNAGFYTQGVYSDMYILELARLYRYEPYYRRGLLEPVKLNIRSTLSRTIRVLPIDVDSVTITYIRFRDSFPAYQLSLPFEVDLNRMVYMYTCLNRWSAPGYPIPLEYAHRYSRLPKKQLLKILMYLGIPLSTGREAIEI